MKRIVFAGLILLSCLFVRAIKDEYEEMLIHYNNQIQQAIPSSDIDSVEIFAKRYFRVFDKQRKMLCNFQISRIDSVTWGVALPKADILDISFKQNGTATNLTESGLRVECIDGNSLTTFYDSLRNDWSCHFNHEGDKATSGYYRVNYADNQTVKDGLANGHTMECYFCTDYLSNGSNELKMFSGTQSGGVGFLISKTANGNTLAYIPYLTNAGASSYTWAKTNINPEPGRYYHVVGVYDQQAQKASIYLDGQLVSQVDALGTYTHPNKEDALWFGIGGDASANAYAEAGWKGDVAIARIYDTPLNAAQIKLLYEAAYTPRDYSNFFCIRNISFSDHYKEGKSYEISGQGFLNGDLIQFESITKNQIICTLPATITTGKATITMPSDFTPDKYRLWVVRGQQRYLLGKSNMTNSDINSLNGLNVAFVGNSHIYFGGVVTKGSYNNTDTGLFYQLCKSQGWNTTVYDCVWGGKTIAECVDLINLSATVRASIRYVFFNQPVPGTESTFISSCKDMAKLFPNAKFYYLLTYYNEDSSSRKTTCLNMVNSLKSAGYDIEVIHWGQLCTDLIKKNVTTDSHLFTYSSSSFKISDQSHPNPLSGYIQAQSVFTRVTGISAQGQDYSFCTSAKYGDASISGYSGYIKKYYENDASMSNFEDIMQSPSEMQGIQKLIDTYAVKQ